MPWVIQLSVLELITELGPCHGSRCLSMASSTETLWMATVLEVVYSSLLSCQGLHAASSPHCPPLLFTRFSRVLWISPSTSSRLIPFLIFSLIIYQWYIVHFQARILAQNSEIYYEIHLSYDYILLYDHLSYVTWSSIICKPLLTIPLCPGMSDWLRDSIHILVSSSNHCLTGKVEP